MCKKSQKEEEERFVLKVTNKKCQRQRRLDALLLLSMELFYQELGYKHSLRVLVNVSVWEGGPRSVWDQSKDVFSW